LVKEAASFEWFEGIGFSWPVRFGFKPIPPADGLFFFH